MKETPYKTVSHSDSGAIECVSNSSQTGSFAISHDIDVHPLTCENIVVPPGTQVTPVRALIVDCAKSSPIAHHTRLRMLQKQTTAVRETQATVHVNEDELCRDGKTIATININIEDVSDDINFTLNSVLDTVSNLDNVNIMTFGNEILDAISSNSNKDKVNHSYNALGDGVQDRIESSGNTSSPSSDNANSKRDSAVSHEQDLLTLCLTEEEARELEGATPLTELRDLFPLAKWQPDIPAGNPTVIIQQTPPEDPNTFCEECGIELNEGDAYARHRMRVHGDLSSSAPFNPVYMCHACSQSFSTLQRKRSHTCPKSKPSKFKCNMCLRDCCTGKGLREHLQRVHHIFPKRRSRQVPDSQRGPDDLPEVQNEETPTDDNNENHRTVNHRIR
ncbi:hypothetical protein AVEN_226066-1 [Araneus ventricosus]|uniref:C2H2-type domain-containing protein n=1 Tax=Araneus ventricosus TaxID=182803 RepID=A0A4Y2RVB6_ARAVE|nr:hypothetical protein AVEN_226066-1 [Araneus ventricosus]